MVNISRESVRGAFIEIQSKIGVIKGVTSAAFYGLSPVESKAENPDLDVLVTVEDKFDEETLNNTLQMIAKSSGIPVDAWVLSERELKERMQRIASKRQQPVPYGLIEEWKGFAYIAAVGMGVLSAIIEQANENPIYEKPIPPTPESKKFFRP